MGGFYHEDENVSSVGMDSGMNFIDARVLDRGLSYGEGCFETFRIINGQIFAWPEHMERLTRGLAEFGISLSSEQMQGIFDRCLVRAGDTGSDVLMRITVTGGSAEWGLLKAAAQPNVYIQAVPFVSNGKPDKSLSLRAWPFPLKQRPAKFISDYGDTLRALRDSAHADVLFVSGGSLLGAATANVLVYRNGQWWTPDGPGVLEGVVRGYLIRAGLVQAAVCPVKWVHEAEAVLLSNCGALLQSVVEVQADGEVLKFDSQHKAIAALSDSLLGQSGLPERLGVML